MVLLVAEIRRSPVEVGSLSNYLRSFYASQVVVWDFIDQQYHIIPISIWNLCNVVTSNENSLGSFPVRDRQDSIMQLGRTVHT